MSSTTNPPGRTRLLVQPAIVKAYRLIGIGALVAIVVGLLAFTTTNLFYYFNRTWVRPTILSPTHEKVIEATTALNEARLRKSELEAERDLAHASLAQLERLIPANQKFEDDAAKLVGADLKGADRVLVQREIERSSLERAEAEDRKQTLASRLRALDGRLSEQRQLIERLEASPYTLTEGKTVMLGFVAYDNLSNVEPGTDLYGCLWGLVGCHKVGKIGKHLPGEVKDSHPHDGSAQRGIMVELHLSDAQAAEDPVLFAGAKPLLLL